MIDAFAFAFLLGLIAILLSPVWFYYHIDPLYVFALITLLLAPGFYASFTGGPYVASAKERQKIMLKLARIKKGEIVYDLGCGDGALVFAAGKKGAHGIGYELSLALYLWGHLQMIRGRKGTIRFGNLWKQDYSDADIIFCYLLPHSMSRFYRDIWPTLKKGTRVVSNAFPLKIQPTQEEGRVFLYVK